MGLVTITLWTAKGPTGTTEIVISIQQIIEMVYFVPQTADVNNKPWFENNRFDLETSNRIY